jgi:zinc transport system substrate-binding protein
VQAFLGNHGADGLVVVDPAEEPHMRRIALPFRRVDFVLDPARPMTGYVLTEDGTLHRIDMLAAEIAASARVTDAYSMDGHWNDPRPRLAMAGDAILMTDPRAGLLRVISAETLAETETIPVEGMPYNLTVTGGSGMTH